MIYWVGQSTGHKEKTLLPGGGSFKALEDLIAAAVMLGSALWILGDGNNAQETKCICWHQDIEVNSQYKPYRVADLGVMDILSNLGANNEYISVIIVLEP